MRATVLLLAAIAALCATARADVGMPVQAELSYVQSTAPFRGVAVDNGPLSPGLQRWKLSTAPLEQKIFAVDGRALDAPVTRETYIRLTQTDPFSLLPLASSNDLTRVLSPREYRDYRFAQPAAVVEQRPLRLIVHFYRGRFAAYEVLEPSVRSRAGQDRFEWRSFSLTELGHAIAAARACNNGADCAAFPFSR